MKDNIKKFGVKIVELVSKLIPMKWMAKKSFFEIWQKKGIHITPVHFYENIPDTREIKEKDWNRVSKLTGIEVNEKEQLRFLKNAEKYKKEFEKYPQNKIKEGEYYSLNGQFSYYDGIILYTMVRTSKPKRIIEIGSGNSTLIIRDAVNKNKLEGVKCEIIVIDPFPKEQIKNEKRIRLIEEKLENVNLDMFKKLNKGDILFIDSSHTARIGNDVYYEQLEIIPNVRKGVLIHIHDIHLPFEYEKDFMLRNKLFWNEQYMVETFLMFNESFKIKYLGRYMFEKNKKSLINKIGRSGETEGSASLWIERVE